MLRDLCSRRCVRPSKRMSVSAAAFRSTHGIGAGTSIVLFRWHRRAAFVGPAAGARPCGHALFLLRFLARASAGADGSFIGRAGRGLALGRRNERRAEERRNDESRDCKFRSHQKCLRRVTGSFQSAGLDFVPAHGKHCTDFIFKMKFFGDRCATNRYFQTSVTLRT